MSELMLNLIKLNQTMQQSTYTNNEVLRYSREAVISVPFFCSLNNVCIHEPSSGQTLTSMFYISCLWIRAHFWGALITLFALLSASYPCLTIIRPPLRLQANTNQWHVATFKMVVKSYSECCFHNLWHVPAIFIYFFSEGARPKITKRNSMDSVELWKYSADKVTEFCL